MIVCVLMSIGLIDVAAMDDEAGDSKFWCQTPVYHSLPLTLAKKNFLCWILLLPLSAIFLCH